MRRFGIPKEGVIARQFMLGAVHTAEGLPGYHKVFEGNQAEGPTFLSTLRKVLDHFPQIRRLLVVADQGPLSLDNPEELGKISLPSLPSLPSSHSSHSAQRTAHSAQALEFIPSVPCRHCGEFTDVLQAIHTRASAAQQETIEEAS